MIRSVLALSLVLGGCATQQADLSPLTGRLVPLEGASVQASAQLVTVQQFALFVGNTGYQARGCEVWDGHSWILDNGLSWANPGFPQSPEHPVVCISQLDARAYVEWLNAVLKPESPYRLMQSHEWDAIVASRPAYRARERLNCAEARCRDGYRHTSPVHAFRPVGGFYDLAGNAYTLTNDFDEQGRVVTRGSSWRTSSSEFLAPSFHNSIAPNERSNIVGFRIAQDRVSDIRDEVLEQTLAQHP